MQHNTGLAKDRKTDLEKFGLDMEEELMRQQEGIRIMPPTIKIDHDQRNGAHRFYVKHPPAYDAEVPEIEEWPDEWKGIVIAEQSMRALFEEDCEVPKCAAIEGIPRVDNPLAERCDICRMNSIGSPCRPKRRLIVLCNGKPYMFEISPASLKHWRRHIAKLSGSKWLLFSVHTKFSLKDIQKPGKRYAEVVFGFGGHVEGEELVEVVTLRKEFEQFAASEDAEEGEAVAVAEPASTSDEDDLPF